MDSCGIGELVGANQRAHRDGRRLILVKSEDTPIDTVLHVAAVDQTIGDHDRVPLDVKRSARLRTTRTTSPPAATRRPRPGPRAPQPMAERIGTLAPALTPASTPREPSAFMTTIDHEPCLTSHVSVCWPEPWADAAQKRWSLGTAGRLPAPWVR
jgi:hypothetical protein